MTLSGPRTCTMYILFASAFIITVISIYIATRNRKCEPRVLGLQMVPELISNQPKVVLWHNFLNESECQHMIQLGDHRLNRSTVQGKNHEISPQRTSYTTNFQSGETSVIQSIEQRVSMLCMYPQSHIEPLQLVRYNPGQQYKPHYDFFVPGHEATGDALKRGGQRTLTFFIYLNDVDQGGTTHFPKLNLRIKPRMGTAVMWYNVLPDGTEDYLTFHAGEPPKSSTKYGLNVWIRERPFE
jgi:prolyl 4-hydroxylase